MKKLIAFTLAETLVVIGIIGVVSALTLPNLNSSTGNKEKVAKVKKIYQNLNDARGRAEAVYGPFQTWFINDPSNDNGVTKGRRFGERMTQFMKVSKDCGMAANQGCFPTNKPIRYRNGTLSQSNWDEKINVYKVITADGATIGFYHNGITIDIDGPTKGPNGKGDDVFTFELDNNMGIVPNGTKASLAGTLTFAQILTDLKNSGQYCALWITRYDNADYLQFTDTSGTCKNGTVVTEANPRCK